MVGLLLLLQSAQWTVGPQNATVGDTVVMERVIQVTGVGVRARVSPVVSSTEIEPLGEPEVLVEAVGVRIRHTVAVFAPGTLRVDLPDIELLHEGGEFETVDGGEALVVVHSVLPVVEDSMPEARPSLAPIGRVTTNAKLPILLPATVLSGALIWGLLRRRRKPRPTWESQGPDVVEPPVERWIQAGEPRAVAALAMTRIRERLQELAPETNPAMSNREVLAVLEDKHPAWPLGGLSETLLSLERASFAPAIAADVMAIVESAEQSLRSVEEASVAEQAPVEA